MAKIIAALLITLLPATLMACPLIGGMVDYNCDGQHKVVIIGDSIVRGIGDADNNNRGGYVLRLQKKFKKSIFVNLGKPGYSTERLYSELKSKLSKRSKNAIKDGVRAADIIFVDAGRNDFFEDLEPGMTVRNLERIVTLLREQFNGPDDVVPLVEIATLLPTKRGFQRPFISDVNNLLLQYSSSNLPVRLFFNLLDEELISNDGIHPASFGYKKIAQYIQRVLKGSVKQESLANREDSDRDGIYDIFERSKFGTNPNKADTDEDSLLDGEEVFNTMTDPLTPDI